jgi:AcrR family transcriptional regulator
MPQGTAEARRRRSDGERTHAAILDAAVRLASVEGIGALTIGRLAEEVGVSKSGLYAHFRSKQDLQLEIVAVAREIFDREVVAPAMAAPEGRARLERLCEAYLSYSQRRVFPGGCFFAGMLAEFDAQSGPLHEEVVADQREWVELVETTARQAQARGDLRADADVGQLAFELTSVLEHANYYIVLFDDQGVVARARRAVHAAIERAAS